MFKEIRVVDPFRTIAHLGDTLITFSVARLRLLTAWKWVVFRDYSNFSQYSIACPWTILPAFVFSPIKQEHRQDKYHLKKISPAIATQILNLVVNVRTSSMKI